MCSFKPTAEALIELIQEDAFPKSFMRYLTNQLPLGIRLMVKDDNTLFATENIRADLIQIAGTQNTYLNCKFPPLNVPTAMVIYRPKVTFTISPGGKQISLPSKGCCFATDTCGKAVFLTLSEKAAKEISKMLVLKGLTDYGWDVVLTSFGFTAPKKYQSLTNSLPTDPMAELFSDFHYNMLWKGITKITLKNTSDFTINMKMTGQVFSFVEDLNSLLTRYFSQPIKSIFHGSVEFTFHLQALGEKFYLTFHANSVVAKSQLGGPPLRSSECHPPQGFTLTLDRESKPFKNSILSTIIRPNGGIKYLQIYYSINGGEDIAALDPNNNLRSLEYQTQDIKRVFLDVQIFVPELQETTQKWTGFLEETLVKVIKARNYLSSSSDLLQLKKLIAEIDSDLDKIPRVLGLLIAKSQPYRNRSNIENSISRLLRLKSDLPETISLVFTQSSIRQSFAGVRFALLAQICHKRLCFTNINCNVWSLTDNYCLTNSSGIDSSVIVEGTALRDIPLGTAITFPARRPLRMLISRKNEPLETTFECFVKLLGLTKNTSIRMVGHKLFFSMSGPIFGTFETLLNVTAEFKNVADWNSLLFGVKGTMNKSSGFHMMLERKIANETTLAAKEAHRRLGKAKAAFSDAKMKADAARKVLKEKQTITEQLRREKENAAEDLRVARLQYQLAKVRFNNTVYLQRHILNPVCEIRECNYTCLKGCVQPNFCKDPINITYLERYCDTVDKPMTVKVVESSTKKRSFAVQTYHTVYTGNCRSGVSFKKIMNYAKKGAQVGKFVGGIIGSAFGPVGTKVGKVIGTLVGAIGGGVVGYFSKKIFGCSDTYETVLGEPRLVEYEQKSFEVKAVVKMIKEIECSGHEEKTKPGGFGPPYPCCKRYGCQSKVIDPLCIKHNEECLIYMTELKFTLDALNETFQYAFLNLRESVDNFKKATAVYEKARIRHEAALNTLQKVKSYTEQSLSAVEIVNASMLHVRRVVYFGLKISQAMNATNSYGNKTVDVGDLKFSLTTASEDAKKILFQCNVNSANSKSTLVSFIVDFDQVERSISSASKTILSKLFGGTSSRKKRVAPDEQSQFGNSSNINGFHISFTDYPHACQFVNSTHLFLSSILHSLDNLISAAKGLDEELSSGFQDLDRLTHTVGGGSSNSNISNSSSISSNSSFVTDYLEMIELLRNESIQVRNDSSQSWNETFEAWRAFLEVFTHNSGFQECAGAIDCIEYFFEGLREFYEFERSPRALKIKDALPKLKDMIMALTSEVLTMPETEKALQQAVLLLNETRDHSVLCGGTPYITSSPQKEIIILTGESLLLRCIAESEADIKYAWMRNDKLVEESLDGTFNVSAISEQHEGAYVCVASNNKGSSLSNVTIIKVHNKPSITLHPQPQRVVVDSEMPATFVCNATGQPAPTFEWFFVSINSSFTKVNETRPVLHMTGPRQHQEGYYYCEASNDHGVAISQKARLDVLGYSVGLPRLLFALNISLPCWQALNSSNSSVHEASSCNSSFIEALSSSENETMTDDILFSLARSLNVSVELISEFEYGSRNNYTATIAFILDIDKEAWKQSNFTRHIQIVGAIAEVSANLIEKVEQFNSSIMNKTFEIPWNNSVVYGDPGSLLAYPLSPKCPDGQALHENGYICANCPAGSSYAEEDETCTECPLGTYQPVQGQTRCISCGTNLTTAFNGTVEESDCIADCPAGSYSTKNRTCSLCPLGMYQPSRGKPACLSCGKNLTTVTNGTVQEIHCIANCPAGSYSFVNRTCALCPLGSYQPSDGQIDCLPCGQGLTTVSPGTVSKSQCEEIQKPVTEDKTTSSTPLVTSRNVEMETGTNEQLTTKTPGEAKEQENSQESSWKLPVIIVPLLVALVVGPILTVVICKRRRVRRNDSKPSIEPARTAQFENPVFDRLDNPIYGFAEQKPRKQAKDNEYSLAEGLGKVAFSEDNPGEFYDDIKDFKKDATNDVADEPIYEILDSSLEEKTGFSFTNSGFQ
ncbi:Sushi, von Willebrand factor type A, EGF and pentraxin domain-containing protein 1 [Stylophora pistillata]|uniref:Sushi, von Willebrand factor type A, EGF and pentraxin domain-containing protein 1 n=2 Tax=Stylophora pistillata TaxID=50429 RepID=A0A2B4SUB1_STYPI|nr:Sushi, von Willebrand factor type A, EGF and pentraxin domain-containing protein 1 [Stylophora pistillata]